MYRKTEKLRISLLAAALIVMAVAFLFYLLQSKGFFVDENRYDAIIADGAIRSGKTSAMSLSFILWAMSTFNDKNFIIAGKTIRSVERNLIKELLKNFK